MENRSGCLVCNKEIVYGEDDEYECYYCGEIRTSNATCEDGHFVCDVCHSSSANDLIERFTTSSEIKDPLEMALVLLRSPQVRIHGPEHHFLIPAVLLSSYYNLKEGEESSKKDAIAKARKRAEKVPGGFCGSHGNCGAGVGAGIFISLITKATPLSDEGWRLSNLMTSKSLQRIAEAGGPRCCKRDTYISIIEAVDFLKENFGVEMDIKRDSFGCEFSSENKECLRDMCPFFKNS
ncbi:MAG: DUF5714 domain-containing protein [Halobacteriota archaeon]|nr:DUF5714 domain-containing protein [Halobacteriota archaeon]